MKTVDLIPLILLELNGGDKYGLEITKNIETRSAGRIVIKQPTLYTILKKLEKSKFISSYWLDSDIGGKRHYYKLTENGKLQAQTLPNYNTVLENILAQDTDTTTTEVANSEPVIQTEQQAEKQKRSAEILFSEQPTQEEKTQVSIMDIISVEQKETVLPTQEVFNLSSIDNTTEADINQQNTSILKSETENKQEKFANNTNISSFASKKEALISDEYKDQLKSIYENTNKKYQDADSSYSTLDYNNIKYVDYVDFKQNTAYLKSKRTAKLLSFKLLCTCCYLLALLVLTSFTVKFATDTSVYYVALITGLLCLIFYPVIFALSYQKRRLKFEEKPYTLNLKCKLIVATIVVVLVLILTVVLNLTVIKTSFAGMFNGRNFANFYTPILLSTAICLDVFVEFIVMRKISK